MRDLISQNPRTSSRSRTNAVFLLLIVITGLLFSMVAGCNAVARDAGGAASNTVQQQGQREQRLKEENDIINSSSQAGQH